MPHIVGDSTPMRELLETVARIGPQDITVLVRGETGTGKELIASQLHAQSSRSSGPLVRFNCAAIPGELAEAELFGHARLDLPGALLFAVMFLWQVPHFLAISLVRREEFARAGLQVQPNEPDGESRARRNIVWYTAVLVGVSFLFVPLGVAGTVYFAAALVSGALFLGYGIHGLRAKTGRRWARNEFLASLAYVTVLFAVLVVDHAFFV